MPVKTAELIEEILSTEQNLDENGTLKTFSIISSPEFLAEGTAISDLENPDRVLIGGNDNDSLNILSELYKRWIPENKILFTNLWSSELSKITTNAFLAQRVSSINSISALCEVTGAEVSEVANVVGSDSRIGNKFLSASPGFGGSCFQKDILNLVYLSRFYGLNEVADYWEQVLMLNNWQRKRISKIIVQKLFGSVSSKKIVLLGFAFKPNTNDIRESAAIYIANDLMDNGAEVVIHDPKVSNNEIEKVLNFNRDVSDNINKGFWSRNSNVIEAVRLADAIVILTEWKEYYSLDWENIFKVMRKPAWLFDTRAVTNLNDYKFKGINYWSIGRGIRS